MTDETERLTVIIPCLNEESSIEETVNSVLEVAEHLPMRVEPLLIDDGSTDGTRGVMERLCAQDDRCRLIAHSERRGVGAALTGAFATIEPRSWVTGIPGDNEFVFDSIREFVEVRHEYDLILGYYRNPIIRPLRRRIASTAFRRTINVLYGFSFKYLNGMKLYRAEVFQGIDVVSRGHAFNGELLAKAVLRNPRLRIGEVPFMARGRRDGVSRAFRPGSVAKALMEVERGRRAVAAYRAEVIAKED